jgi:RHS repeat-associated protein
LYSPGRRGCPNPAFRIPLGFAGGLHDRDLGFVRFGWGDYDVKTGRWTAPDPMGEKGGGPTPRLTQRMRPDLVEAG